MIPQFSPEFFDAVVCNFSTSEEIAADQGCSKDTIERNCAALLEKGRDLGKLSLRAQQYRVAMGLPGKPAEYLRKHQDKDGKQYGDLVLNEKGQPIKVRAEVKDQPPSIRMLEWLGIQYLGQANKFSLPDNPFEGFGFSFQKGSAK